MDNKTPIAIDNRTEWLEADGLGGFASGTTCGERTRRYHALLLSATRPPTGRMALVNGFDAWVETPNGKLAISTQRYSPGVVYPDGRAWLVEFNSDPWPRWTYRIDDQTSLVQELFVPHGIAACALRWSTARLTAVGAAGPPAPGSVSNSPLPIPLGSQVLPHGSFPNWSLKSNPQSPGGRKPGEGAAQRESPPYRLTLRPFFSGRDYHSLHHQNPAFRFDAAIRNGWRIWHPYEGVPAICAFANADYLHEPEWFRNFLYIQEQERGLDCVEDLASPGTLRWNLDRAAVLILSTESASALLDARAPTAEGIFDSLAETQRQRRSGFATPLHRSADAFFVRRKISNAPDDSPTVATKFGQTIIAGYPWFTDWGRDTFISLRGLCLATGRLDEAREILLAWAGTVSEGMLPNRFPDAGDQPEFNSVDASLWFIVAVHDLLETASRLDRSVDPADRHTLEQAILAIVGGYASGTRFGIRMDSDSLLAAGQPGTQLTWMDAKIGNWVVTPRIGKPVEVQALWLNALSIASQLDSRWALPLNQGREEFARRFWNPTLDCLYDVVDDDHQSGANDGSLRPNQIFAVGGLPLALLEGQRAEQVIAVVERHLLTPLGLRTLSPGSPNYTSHYGGDARQRDAAYHQGTSWPWLLGPFVEAWLRVRGNTPDAKRSARQQFLPPLGTHLQTAGLNHISEITDAEPPFAPHGCPFQAWSLGEFMRLQSLLSD